MSDLIPDLSWEEIAKQGEQWMQENVKTPTIVPNSYLQEIKVVNDALSKGRTIAIRAAHHSFTCPPGELHPTSDHAEEGCLLQLKKVIVEFHREIQNCRYRITLRFWDSTHDQEVLWGATLVQPQWETMVQQAQKEEGASSPS